MWKALPKTFLHPRPLQNLLGVSTAGQWSEEDGGRPPAGWQGESAGKQISCRGACADSVAAPCGEAARPSSTNKGEDTAQVINKTVRAM